jgi:hypothetical protein
VRKTGEFPAAAIPPARQTGSFPAAAIPSPNKTAQFGAPPAASVAKTGALPAPAASPGSSITIRLDEEPLSPAPSAEEDEDAKLAAEVAASVRDKQRKE